MKYNFWYLCFNGNFQNILEYSNSNVMEITYLPNEPRGTAKNGRNHETILIKLLYQL